MKEIKLEDFQIIPIVSSAKRLKISDEVYFSSKYAGYISNSRLATINKSQGGSPQKYQKGLSGDSTASLQLGSAVHELVLQPESFTLGPKCGKPTAKLGATIDRIKFYRKKGESIYDSIVKASKDCNYYVNQIDSKIPKIIKEGLGYYLATRDSEDSVILLNDKDFEACSACVKNISEDINIQNVLHPKDDFGDPYPSFNEDAIFLDVLVTYKDKHTTLKLKMKADNWTIDEDNKILTLNDLKTTSKPVAWFMNRDYGSFYHYHYYRQFALYKMMLETYCVNEYGFNHNWTSNGNVLVVNTIDYNTRLCRVTKKHLEEGKREYENLLKQVAYYEIYGYDEEVKFI